MSSVGVHWRRSSNGRQAIMNEWIIVGIVAIAVIFGATKLPEIARNLGRSSNEFKKGLKEGSEDADQASKAEPQAPAQSQTPAESEPPGPIAPS
jgi:sec-independent protein translocase protein TatA